MKGIITGIVAVVYLALATSAGASWQDDIADARSKAIPEAERHTPLGKLATDIVMGQSPFNNCSSSTRRTYDDCAGKIACNVKRQIHVLRLLRKQAGDVGTAAAEVKSLAKLGEENDESRPSAERLSKVVRQAGDHTENVCETKIITLESQLRADGKTLEKRREDLSKLVLEEKNVTGFKGELDDVKAAYAELTNTISYVEGNSIIRTFDDYGDGFYYKFNLGFEYATVKTVFQKGFPRVGFLVYHQYTPEWARKRDRQWGWKIGEVHTSLATRLTSSAEEATTENPDITKKQPVNMGDKPSLEYDVQAFLPIVKTMNFGNFWSEVGIIGVFGGSKTDDVNRIHQRRYAGMRLAISPELYTDVMYGKTEGTHSRRLEIRGQMPIYRPKADGSPIVIGAIANMGVKDVGTDADSIRIYVSWDIDMGDLFKIFNPESKK